MHPTKYLLFLYRLQMFSKTIRKSRKWSDKYKRSINCRRPRGFSQRQHCKYGRKTRKYNQK
jgi:hypothetical protein